MWTCPYVHISTQSINLTPSLIHFNLLFLFSLHSPLLLSKMDSELSRHGNDAEAWWWERWLWRSTEGLAESWSNKRWKGLLSNSTGFLYYPPWHNFKWPYQNFLAAKYCLSKSTSVEYVVTQGCLQVVILKQMKVKIGVLFWYLIPLLKMWSVTGTLSLVPCLD